MQDGLARWLPPLAAVLTVACTKPQFSSRDTDTDAGDAVSDAADASDALLTEDCFPTGPENCNGVDDDCDGNVDDGAGVSCPTGGNVQFFGCVEGGCVLDCMAGFENCNDVVGDGCETVLGTSSNCSRCNEACAAPSYCVSQRCCDVPAHTNGCTVQSDSDENGCVENSDVVNGGDMDMDGDVDSCDTARIRCVLFGQAAECCSADCGECPSTGQCATSLDCDGFVFPSEGCD